MVLAYGLPSEVSHIVIVSLQGLIFVVDSSDRERIHEAASELQTMVDTEKSFFGFICSSNNLSMDLVHEAFVSWSSSAGGRFPEGHRRVGSC